MGGGDDVFDDVPVFKDIFKEGIGDAFFFCTLISKCYEEDALLWRSRDI